MDVAVFGVIVADVIGSPMDLRHPPPSGGLQSIDTLQLTTGGSVCNVGIALSRLGMKVAAAGMVGNDSLGDAILERLEFEKFDISGVHRSSSAQTSATIVAIEPGGQRTFYHAPGVTRLIDAELFRKCIPQIQQAAWLHVGYFGLLPALTPDLPMLLAELKQLAPGTRIALDTLDPPADWNLLQPILPMLDVFAPSRPEAIALSSQTDPKRIIEFFRQFMPRGLIGIKLDRDGCILDDGERTVLTEAYPIQVVDSTGAGDAWFAGLLAGLRHQMPLEQCAKLANRVAGDCCSAFGASTGIQSLEKTLNRL